MPIIPFEGILVKCELGCEIDRDFSIVRLTMSYRVTAMSC